MDWKKIGISTVVVGIVLLLVGMLDSFTWVPVLHPGMMAEYESGAYRSWEDPLMSYIFLHPFVSAFLMAITFSLFDPFKGKVYWKRGVKFALWFWLIAVVPGMLISYSSFAESIISGKTILVWTIDGLITYLVGGIILAYLFERK